MAEVRLRSFDAANYVETSEDVIFFLEDAIADPDPAAFLEALGVVARSSGMTEIARKAGLSRPALYRALTADGHPEFQTVVSVLKSMGMRLNLQQDTAKTLADAEKTIATSE